MPGAVLVSRQGTLAAADVVVADERITLVSMYAGWEGHRPGPIYADASAHPLLSDLSGIVNDARSHQIIVAGDLNILHRYGEHGNTYWSARYATVFDRAKRWVCDSSGRRHLTAGRRIRGQPSCRKARGMSHVSHLEAGSDGCDTSTRLCLRFSRVSGPAIGACPECRSRRVGAKRPLPRGD